MLGLSPRSTLKTRLSSFLPGKLRNCIIHQLQVLRVSTVDKINEAIIDKLTSVAEVMSHLYSRYGTQKAVVKRVLDDQELLPPPSDTSLEDENLVK